MESWILGKRGRKTREWVPEASAIEQRKANGFFVVVVVVVLLWRVLFGSLKGAGTPITRKQGSKTGEQVTETGA